ncbi:hypothetical protein [Pontibacter fetidus]|uniref:Uncharacterized protein n=1 Tax=Pontibacter fetidus TaxID=2700082 RepID=A0A6B2GW30_9BACT|nr:hypothetical protein [Pontibacter fetidus]NDK55015.1 hypothetical protein [Pontibacter fetidus]
MKTLYWKQKSWGSRAYDTFADGLHVGNLAFGSWFSYDAAYTSAKGTFVFKQQGWFDQDVEILYNGEQVAVAHTSVFGNTRIQLSNGENYMLTSKTLSRDVTIKDMAGNTCVMFKQATFSFGKGILLINSDLPELTSEMLTSAGLYLKIMMESKVAIMVVIFFPILMRMFD